jgi:hypothetical protein
MTKGKGQKDKEKLEGTKKVIRSVNRKRTNNTITKEKGQKDKENLEDTCLSFYLGLLITSLVSSSFSLYFCPFSFVIVLSVLLFTASHYLFGIFNLLFELQDTKGVIRSCK